MLSHFRGAQPYPRHPNFLRVDEALASHFALASWYGFVVEGRHTEALAQALRADASRKVVQLSFTGCSHFSDNELELLMRNLPAHLRVLRLDLGFSGLTTLEGLASATSLGCLQSLVQLTLRFTSSLSLRTAAGLADALIEMGNLMYLELWSAKS
jgi:hypothetical protein